jgi:hypothetical protein
MKKKRLPNQKEVNPPGNLSPIRERAAVWKAHLFSSCEVPISRAFTLKLLVAKNQRI